MWCEWLIPLILLFGAAILGFLIGYLLRSIAMKKLETAYKEQVAGLEQDLSNSKRKYRELEQEHQAALAKQAQQRKELNLQQIELDNLNKSLEITDKALTTWKKRHREQEDTNNTLEQQLGVAKEIMEQQNVQLEDLGQNKADTNKLTSLEQDYEQQTTNLRQLEEEKNKLQALLDQLKQEQEALQQQYNNLEHTSKEALAIAKDKQEAQATTIKNLEAELAQQENTSNASEVDASAAPPTKKTTKKETKSSKEAATLERIRAKAKDLDFERIGVATYAERDDLKTIKGIGPFIEKKLHALGIYTFWQIANLSEEDEDKVNVAIEFFPGRIRRDQWVKQGGELHQEKQEKENEASEKDANDKED